MFLHRFTYMGETCQRLTAAEYDLAFEAATLGGCDKYRHGLRGMKFVERLVFSPDDMPIDGDALNTLSTIFAYANPARTTDKVYLPAGVDFALFGTADGYWYATDDLCYYVAFWAANDDSATALRQWLEYQVQRVFRADTEFDAIAWRVFGGSPRRGRALARRARFGHARRDCMRTACVKKIKRLHEKIY